MSCRSEGDAKLQEFQRSVQSVCSLDLDEPRKQELRDHVRRAEDQWMSIIQSTREVLGQAERRCSLNDQLRDFRSLNDTTRTWLEDKQQSLGTLDSQTDPEKAITDTQVSRRRPRGRCSSSPGSSKRLCELNPGWFVSSGRPELQT